jgi:hypothetical protein
MQDKELSKKKSDLLHSIMNNPKLAKSFSEAFSAPIGSTKRDQAKSLFSIMKKIGGVRADGQGGPFGSGMDTPGGYGAYQAPSSQLTVSPFQDYSNLMIFPPAGKLKGAFGGMKLPEPKPADTGVKSTPSYQPQPDFLSGLNNTWGNQWDTVSNKLSKNISNMSGAYSTPSPSNQFPNLSLSDLPAPTTKKPITGLTGAYEDVPQTGWNPYSSVQAQLDSMKSKQTPTGEVASTGSTEGLGPYYPDATQDTKQEDTPTYTDSTPPVDSTEPKLTGIQADAAKAVAEGTGAGFFAKGIVDEKFGGSLDAYMNAFDEKIRTHFNLTGLETELSNLKAQKKNLIPTMQNYIRGRDKYLSFIDKMIEKTEGTLMSRDMGNPAVAASYNKYMTYLYTLKGRQNQRYGNFLNSAISDYNADLERASSNYENVYKQYSDMMNRQTNIATTEYNALYNSLTDLYTSLEGAPTRQATLEALQIQNSLNTIKAAKDLLALSGNTNIDYFKDLKTYSDNVTDNDGNLSLEKLGAGGLAGFFAEIAYTKGDPQAAAKAINTAMANSILNNPGDLGQIQKFKDMIASLSLVEGGDQLASMISPSLNKASEGLMSNYILNNISRVKNATKDLVKGGWFGEPGLNNKEKWLDKNDDLDSDVLEDLFTLTQNATASGAYATNPEKFVSDWFAGTNNDDIAKKVAKDLITSW